MTRRTRWAALALAAVFGASLHLAARAADAPPPAHPCPAFAPEPATTGCEACHSESAWKRNDPHHPRDGRDPADTTCMACHRGIPPDDALPEESRLRAGVDKACTFCHEGEIHAGAREHLGKAARPEKGGRDPGGELPLDRQGHIACFTCHEVHGPRDPRERAARGEAVASEGRDTLRRRFVGRDWEGSLPEAARLPGAAEPEHPRLLVRPLDDLCAVCHGDGP